MTELIPMIGYLRVSTREQARKGYGLGAQRTALRAAGRERGWDLTFLQDKGFTGANMKRKGIQAALRSLASGEAKGLAVAKLDRVSRSVVDFGTLLETARKRGWSFAALDLGVDTSTPAGELVANVMIAVAQWERRVISDRTRDGLAEARAEGKRLGRPRRIAPDLLARIVDLHNDGTSNRAIAHELNAEGTPTVNGGKRWYGGTIQGLVESVRLDVELELAVSTSEVA